MNKNYIGYHFNCKMSLMKTVIRDISGTLYLVLYKVFFERKELASHWE